MNTTQPTIEVTLGNWGTVRCHNEQHKEYLIAAHAARDIEQSILSWHGAWLSPEQKANYEAAYIGAQAKCEDLWEKIPDKADLLKSHSALTFI